MHPRIRQLRNSIGKKLEHRRNFASDKMPAAVEFEEDGARVHIGAQSFFVRSFGVDAPRHQVVDFALFGLAIISMSANVEIHVNDPVSRSGVDAIRKIGRAVSLWAMPRSFPLRMTFESVIDDPKPARTSDCILAVSGGIDSTSAAVVSSDANTMTHGLLIAGADYPAIEHPGFVELQNRVANLTQILGLSLVTVETDLKKLPFNWEMFHSLNLAMCLSYLSPRFAAGGIAMDNTLQQDLARHPWGNSSALCDVLSLGYFPIIPIVADLDRVEKIQTIARRDPALLSHLSVCWQDISRGGNCGHCVKCAQTRLGFICAGVPEDVAFPTDRPLDECIDGWPLAVRPTALRGANVRVEELVWHLPEGLLKDKVSMYHEKVQRRLRRWSPGR